MNTTDQLIADSLKKFREEFYYLIPNAKQKKDNEAGVIYPRTTEDLEQFLREELKTIVQKTREERDAWLIEILEKKKVTELSNWSQGVNEGIEEAIKLIKEPKP